MLKEVFDLFDKIKVDNNSVSEILEFNFKDMDQLSDKDLSRRCLVLSQYLIYLKYQCNKAKEESVKLKKFIDDTVFYLLTKEILKEHGTKTNARVYLINSVEELKNKQKKADSIDYELILIEGLDKTVQEFINVMKKEISRRENEFYASRYERRK